MTGVVVMLACIDSKFGLLDVGLGFLPFFAKGVRVHVLLV